MIEKTIFVRIRKGGQLHQGDLNRLNGIPGSIIDVQMPDEPKGRVVVTKQVFDGVGVEPVLESGLIMQRSPTFHA